MGFLAGYAAVKEGCTKLGFMGGGTAVLEVIRYGYGFVQGADYAAKKMGISSIEIKYYYTGNFDATAENQTMAASWYGDGTQVIFCCAGDALESVAAAAEAAGGKVIGADKDQSDVSETIITSAEKNLSAAVEYALSDIYSGGLDDGVTDTFDITKNAIGLEMENSVFENFINANYIYIYENLLNDTDGIRTNMLDDTDAVSADEIPTEAVEVEVIQ